MLIEGSWSQPITLTKGRTGGPIYVLDLDDLPETPGVYVFARKHGERVVPIYIGETLSIRSRVKNHLDSLQRMQAIKSVPNGCLAHDQPVSLQLLLNEVGENREENILRIKKCIVLVIETRTARL